MDKEMFEELKKEIKKAQILAMIPNSEKERMWESIFEVQKKGFDDFVKLMEGSFIGD